MTSVECKNLKKIYINDPGGELIAVQKFNLEIKDGEVIVLLGPSGCGKTTALRMVAGLEEISGGELYIDGKLVNNVHPKDRGISMVFQNYALYPYMTVYENIAFGLQPTDITTDEVKEKVEETALIFGANHYDATHLFEYKPRQLSGGQKQLVALARALIRDNKVILLDEPFSNLDAKLRLSMRIELMKLHEKFKKTFIYVTHSQEEAMAMADRIVVMREGLIQQVGTPEELYSHPCNLFVAGFLGTPQMNFWNTKVIEQGGDIYITLDEVNSAEGTKIKLPEVKADKASAYIGKEVIAGIRSEDIYVDEANINKSGGSLIDADVQVREFLGDRVYLYCESGSNTFTIRAIPDFAAGSGDKIKAGLNREKIYLFDKETELAIVN